jgi:hypothetical protein
MSSAKENEGVWPLLSSSAVLVEWKEKEAGWF